ncbi:MAG: cobaltochelatase subunit CobN [Vicinamibacterales bacterium]|nr:cobaltochelatase subunit CobN [Vicinamibacterales bacterium]
MRTLLVLLGLVAGVSSAAAQPVRLAYLFSDGNLPGVLQAYKALLEERPDLREQVTLSFLTESMFDEVEPDAITGADVLVFDIMNQEMLDRFNTTHDVDILADVGGRGMVLAVGQGLMPQEFYTEQGAVWDERARAFWANWGFGNQLGLLKQTLSIAGVRDVSVPEPQPSLEGGYYYPDEQSGRVFATWDEFERFRAAAGGSRPGAVRVAVAFYKSTYYAGDTALLDAVIAEVEAQGAEVVPVFGYPSAEAFAALLLDEAGESRADAALAFVFRFADFEATHTLDRVDIPIVSMVSLYGRSEADWRDSPMGLSMFEGTFQVAVPELAGLVAPTVVGSQERQYDADTGLTIVQRRPIAPRVTMVVRRAIRYGRLGTTPNPDKRVAVLYYNYPPGKAGIGASYLNVADSLSAILRRLHAEGYDLGALDPDTDLTSGRILEAVTTRGRNVAGHAPGELDELLAAGDAELVSVTDYEQWLGAHDPAFRDKVLADWGPPAESQVMATTGPDGPAFVIPVVRFGNVVLMPQPARGWGEDLDKLYHAKDLAPPHQYVAAYAWLRNGFHADAVVHLGTHGTLEWLDGKDIGQSAEDASDALIADLPDLYVYNVDVVGEGLVARRRGMATLIDHMVPPFTAGGLLPELAKLSESVNDYHNNLHKNEQLADAYAQQIRDQAAALGIVKDLGIDLGTKGEIDHDLMHEVEEYLVALRGQYIPYGLHAFGRTPDPEMRASTVEAIVSVDRDLLPNDAEVLAEDMERRIVESAPRELDSLAGALAGDYVPGGTGGEPIRNPDAYPTGKNFYGIDPDKVPKPAAWELGVFMADRMLEEHLEEHGKYPEKVSFVIWGDETMRHEGILESQIFHLLGTRPVWDVRGKVIDVEVVPQSQLGRPRVDIVIASAAEGMFNNVTMLMDRAVQLVKMIEEADNYVRRHYLSTKATLIERGYDEEDADRRAGVRIFDEPPGTYNLNTSRIAAASGTWDSDAPMADEYLSKMGHGFGNGFWGEPMEDVFRMALSGTEKVVHSSSTTLYGALDNDDFFMYMGGLAAAVRNIDGETPELVVTNTRDPGRPEMTPIDQFIGAEFRSRYVSPTWIEGMQREGYAGAGEMSAFVEYLWGWDATVTDVVDDAMWQESFAVYVEDKHDLGMDEFFDANSPFAFQDITARMVETIRKEYWEADEETKARLLTEYVDSVNTHGVGCAEHTCGNARLLEYVLEEGAAAGVPVPALDQFRAAMEEAIGTDIESVARSMEAFVRRNEAAPAAYTENLEGFRMEERREQTPTPTAPVQTGRGDAWDAVWVGVPVIGLLLAWRLRRRRG